jgi:tRNA pseudouridine38-40 synthase
MTTFKLTLAYDGTDFVGWQRQASGTSIQGLLEDALRELDGRDVTVTGAGRTDAGVHALAQVAACSLERTIDAATVARALNARLPPEVRVLASAQAPEAFHPRFDARGKTYRYRIWNAAVISPFEHRYAWHLSDPLDVRAMAEAARLLEGRHDFAAFQATGSDVKTTVREIGSSCVTSVTPAPSGEASAGRLVMYEVTGDGFLRHMVRTIAGTLVEVGRGRRPAAWAGEVLESRDRGLAGQTAPAAGLFLASVRY